MEKNKKLLQEGLQSKVGHPHQAHLLHPLVALLVLDLLIQVQIQVVHPPQLKSSHLKLKKLVVNKPNSISKFLSKNHKISNPISIKKEM